MMSNNDLIQLLMLFISIMTLIETIRNNHKKD